MTNRLILRQELRSLRRQLTSEEQLVAAQQLSHQLKQHPAFDKSHHIALYIAHDHEIDPQPTLKTLWQAGKQTYLPKLDVTQKCLAFIHFQANDPLEPNRYNIPEPVATPHNLLAADALDLVLLPLVGFDAKGNRLGMGAGYYDRTFAFLQKMSRPAKPYLAGLAYELQKIDTLVPENWDVKLDCVITEKSIYNF